MILSGTRVSAFGWRAMWILFGLLGMLAASGAGLMLTRVETADDADEEPVDPASDGEEAGTQTGDLLDFAADPAPVPPDAGDITAPAPSAGAAGSAASQVDSSPTVASGAEPTAAPVSAAPPLTGGGTVGADEGEFISTDKPAEAPPDRMINLGDAGGAAAGGAGHDLLMGGAGQDWLDGDDGNDHLHGAEGDDMLIGGAGADTLLGGAGADTLLGGAGQNRLDGGDGSDSLIGGGDRDTLFGGAGEDTLAGGAGDDSLAGGLGADLLMGGAGADRLNGAGDGAAPDTLNGGLGNDTLVLGAGDLGHGGDGDDDFLLSDWQQAGEAATIADFVEGEDRIIIGYDSDEAPQVDSLFDPETGVLRLMVGGETVAILPNVQSIAPESIILTRLGA